MVSGDHDFYNLSAGAVWLSEMLDENQQAAEDARSDEAKLKGAYKEFFVDMVNLSTTPGAQDKFVENLETMLQHCPNTLLKRYQAHRRQDIKDLLQHQITKYYKPRSDLLVDTDIQAEITVRVETMTKRVLELMELKIGSERATWGHATLRTLRREKKKPVQNVQISITLLPLLQETLAQNDSELSGLIQRITEASSGGTFNLYTFFSEQITKDLTSSLSDSPPLLNGTTPHLLTHWTRVI